MQKNYSLYEGFLDGYNLGKNAPSILFMGKKLSFITVKNRIDALADALKQSFNVKKGDIVTVCLPNIPQTMYAIYAINKLGAVSHLIHALSSLQQVDSAMQKTGSTILFCMDIGAAKFCNLVNHGKTVIVCNPTYELDIVKKWGHGYINRKTTKLPKNSGLIDFKTVLAGSRNKNSDVPFVRAKDFNDTAILLNSGGTSGEPKTVELSDFAINSLCSNGYEILDTTDVTNKYMLSALPYFHGFGLAMGLHAMTCHGGCNVMLPKFKRKDAVGYVLKGQMSYMIGVPALYSALLSHPKFYGDALKCLDVAFVGADFIPKTLLNEFNQRMIDAGSKCRLFEGYGLTETVTVCSVNTHRQNKDGSIGRALNDIEIKTFKTPTAIDFYGQDIPDGEGEICICGETLMNGYYKDDAATAATYYTDKNGKKWLKSGDYGYVDSDGYVFFKQRLKRIIKVSGISVFPSEIEQIASEVAKTNNVCAHEVPDLKKGNAIRLVVENSEPQEKQEILKSEIFAKLSAFIEKDALPKEIIFLDKMPLTPMNKIDINTLKQMNF